jgi:hypothetical protein
MMLHFPLRGAEHVARRARFLAESDFRFKGPRRRLRKRVLGGTEAELHAEMLISGEELNEALDRGVLVRDERLAGLLARCPDPISEPGPPGRISISGEPDVLERERAEVAYDAMHWLAHQTLQVNRSRAHLRRRVAELEGRAPDARD